MAGFDPNQYLAEKAAPAAPSGPTGSGFNPDQYLMEKQTPESPGLAAQLWQDVKDAAHWVGDKYERYDTAPARAGISAGLDADTKDIPIVGKLPYALQIPYKVPYGIVKGGQAFWGQMGEDPAQAPSGSDLAAKVGVPNVNIHIPREALLEVPDMAPRDLPDDVPSGIDVNARTLVGAGINAAADPLLIAGPGKILGAASEGAAAAGKAGTQAFSAGAKTVAKGIDLATGGERAAKTVQAAGNAANVAAQSAVNAKNFLTKIFKADVAPDFSEMRGIAEKAGIDPAHLPESVEFGRDSNIDRLARVERERGLGELSVDQFNDGYNKIQGAIDSKIGQMAGGTPPVDAIAAGQELRKGFQDGVKRFWDGIDMTHDEVQKYAPGLMVDGKAMDSINSTMNGIERFAKGRIARGVSDTAVAQGKGLLQAVNAVRASNGSYKQMVEAIRDIGEEAFNLNDHVGKVPADTAKLRDLYFKINDGLIDTVRQHVNPAFADELVANNEKMTQFFKNKNQIGDSLLNPDVAPENAFKRVVMNGDSDQINALRQFLTPEEFSRQRAAFLQNLIKRGEDGTYDMGHLYRSLRGKQSQVATLFSDAPQDLKVVADFMRLGDRYGSPVMSTSGTGSSIGFHGLVDTIKEGALNDQTLARMKAGARARAAGTIPMAPVPGGTPGVPSVYAPAASSAVRAASPAGRSPIFYAAKGAQSAQAGVAGPQSTADQGQPSTGSNRSPTQALKGEALWAQQGAQALKQHGARVSDAQVQQLSATPRGKALLIQASDLKPGSKAMQNVYQQIQGVLRGSK